LRGEEKYLERCILSARTDLEHVGDTPNAVDEAKVKLSQSLSKQKRIEKKIEDIITLAEKAKDYEDEFLANMSHELRTPLNGIVGFANLISETDLSGEERIEYAGIINTNTKQLLRLLDDIFEIVQIDSGNVILNYSECDLPLFMNEIYAEFEKRRKKSGKNNIKLTLSIPDKKRFRIVTDTYRLREVIGNLIENAIKFSDKGEIRFGYESNNYRLNFFVSDEGIGIPKRMQNIVFDSFTQALPENSAQYGGTGLGLAICKGIISLMGGKMRIKSEKGKGSVFSFSIPLKKHENHNKKIITISNSQNH
jgi:two-component system CheB/CheR fusion protein